MDVASGSSEADSATGGASADHLGALRRAVGAVLQGKQEVVDLALTAILAGGHLLLQDVPGVGKTTLAHALAAAVGGSFRRVQFTADLLPADLTGVNVLGAAGEVRFREGPLFANVVLADEINRTTAKTQSALFEAMEEGQVTIDGTSRPLPRPFLVVATQNPFDLHGTFQLPDSQLDRFLMRLSLGYPDRATERAILKHARRPIPDTVMNPGQLEQLAGRAMSAQVPELVEEYLLDLVVATRSDARFVRGVSTRGAQALHRAVRARAFLAGRRYAVPEDVRDLAVPVLAHRVLVRSVGLEGDGGILAVRALLDELPRPL